jgi:hypothetical protein
MRTLRGLCACFVFALLVTACGSSVGPSTRRDIAKKMSSVKEPLGDCYAAAIRRKGPRTRGVLVVQFRVAADTGRFEKVEVARDDIGDDVLARCLVDRVAKLKLERPADVLVAVTYPVSFEPR